MRWWSLDVPRYEVGMLVYFKREYVIPVVCCGDHYEYGKMSPNFATLFLKKMNVKFSKRCLLTGFVCQLISRFFSPQQELVSLQPRLF